MTRTPLIHLALALALAVGLAGVYAFWFLAVSRADAGTAGVLAEIESKENERERTAAARAALEDLATEEAFVAAHLIPEEGIVSFLERLEEVGAAQGADVSVASVSGDAAGEGRITLSLSISGTFESVMRTLGAIEHGPYAIATQNVTLDSGGEGAWTAVGAFTIGTTNAVSAETP